MEPKPLTNEAIALTEKKMEMSLDEIIKMSKNSASKGKKPPRVSNKNPGFFRRGSQSKSSKVRNFLESRSSIRQGALARRRSSLFENHFPLATEAARKAANKPTQNMVLNRNMTRVAPIYIKVGDDKAAGKVVMQPKQRQTLDARFASIREQRVGSAASQQPASVGANQKAPRGRGQHQKGLQQQPSWMPHGSGRAGSGRNSSGRRFGTFRR